VLRNAIHYTRENTSVEVTLACAGSGDEQKATIAVRDRGPGVPETELENLFRPFYRLDRSRERQTGGVGLGLAIAQRAVLLHQGSIRASNADGGGLKIEIALPLSASSV
jgi:two-component system sensor histidine kinase CpxA